jgi:ketosteroid isomerase-like protein
VDWKEELLALEAEGRTAFVEKDVTRLSQMWSDDLLVNSPINRVNNKEQVLSLLQAGIIAHVSLEGEVETIVRNNDLVVVMGHETVVDKVGGPIVKRRFTDVWREEDGRWLLLIRHANIYV